MVRPGFLVPDQKTAEPVGWVAISRAIVEQTTEVARVEFFIAIVVLVFVVGAIGVVAQRRRRAGGVVAARRRRGR
jgi:hypothetical protein